MTRNDPERRCRVCQSTEAMHATIYHDHAPQYAPAGPDDCPGGRCYGHREPATITAAQIIAAVRDGWPGATCATEQTGGGCATVYVGPYDPETERYAYAIGPGSYDYDHRGRSTFDLGDLYAGPDDDGETDPETMTTAEDLRAWAERQYLRELRADFRGPDALEAAGEDAAAVLEILPPDGSGTYTEAAAVYLYAGLSEDDVPGGWPGMPICGACLVEAGDAVDTRSVGGRTAARCACCEIDGAAARWSEANRGAAIWRAIVVGFEPERARHGRPGIRSPRWAERDARDGAAWARIAHLAIIARG
jgi:hypothetical protein